ncbi:MULTISPECIES: hypothetical protein [Nostoc]|jgi:hypothetical protein|uniref:Uncharacterized protein n=1 Tax=Nostoc punctiforme (strain ATCC 29133 / PCC 73102) TaxID=63737 RepID=B2J896_NOSP7|nr:MULTISPECIES: hypothetical protein [Nostoc]ACC79345.1 conserved hypothetical protein [Nostoc punctiforme PCC 73102]MBE9000932.1 hypothetical protein [Nostoc sp. LEGE 12447]NEU79516.1 hypothetical protein [Nostoc sp. UIC 10630]QKQ74583.1 hypothetical protein FBB35_15735 [Nostoc sp. TCL240-02]
MFINELSPIFREFIQHPASFVGGLFSGVLRLNLADDPVKSWLDQQSRSNSYTSSTTEAHNGKASGPQQISID